jgi:hypothetical protein
MTSNDPDRWEIGQDEFGRPQVRHRHPTGTVPAYISHDADGVTNARCPECHERYLVRDPEPQSPAP